MFTSIYKIKLAAVIPLANWIFSSVAGASKIKIVINIVLLYLNIPKLIIIIKSAKDRVFKRDCKHT